MLISRVFGKKGKMVILHFLVDPTGMMVVFALSEYGNGARF